MALFDNVWINAIIGVALFAVLVYFIQKYRTKSIESKALQEGGRDFKEIAAGEERTIQQLTSEAAGEELEEQRTGKTKDKRAQRAAKANEAETRAEGKTETATAKLTEISAAISADLSRTQNDIKSVVEEKLATESVEEKEIVEIEAVIKELQTKLRFLSNNERMDATASKFLLEYFQGLMDYLQKYVNFEQQNEVHHQALVQLIKKSIEDLEPIAQDAKSKLGTLNRQEKKERRTFQKEFQKIRAAIRKKEEELRKQEQQGNDTAIINSLKAEIALLQKNEAELAGIQSELTKTHELMELQLQKLKALMTQVIDAEKRQKGKAKEVNSREKQVKNRFEQLNQRIQKLKTSTEKFSNPDQIYGTALEFSKDLREYIEYYIGLLEADLQFEKIIKEILQEHSNIEQWMFQFDLLLSSLTKSEIAVDAGMEAITKLVSIIYESGTPGAKGSLVKEGAIIKLQQNTLNQEANVQNYLAELTKKMQQQTPLLVAEVDLVIKNDEKLLAGNIKIREEEQTILGSSLATLANRKIAIDQKYTQETVKFGNQLQKNNEIAGAAYQQATSASPLSRAA